jgi:pimeloyl-ACP methyl ester carboxylesterase
VKKLMLALTVLTLLLVACGSGTTPVEPLPTDPPATSPAADAEEVVAPTAEPTADDVLPTAIPEPVAPPEPIDVDIVSVGGLTLKGTFYGAVPNAAPGVLLLHMYGHTRADWDGPAKMLQEVGIASLAIDLRGHGETGGVENWVLAQQDVAAALAWLAAMSDVDAERLGVVGASIGANLSMVLGAGDPSVDVIGLLSPGFDYFRVQIGGLMALYGDRPALLAATEQDGYSAQTVRAMAEDAVGPVELLVYDGSAHGTDIFDTDPGLIEALVDFLVLYLMN